MKLIKLTYFSLILFIYSEMGFTQSVIKHPSSLNIEIDKNSVTLEANSISLQEILDAFSKISTIKINTVYRLTQSIDITVTKMPIEVFIKRLLSDHNYVIFFKTSSSEPVHNSIEQINIYSASKEPIRQHAQSNRLPDDYSDIDEIFPPEGINQRLELIEALNTKPNNEAVPALNKMLSKERNQFVKQSIIEVLGKRQGIEIVNALANALGDENSRIRASITEALMNQHHSQAPLILAQILFGDPDPEIRAIAAEALGASNSEHIQSFFEAAQNDQDERVRLAVTLH